MASVSAPSNSRSATESTVSIRAQSHAGSVFATQRELLDSLQQMNDRWFARAKSEADLATTLAGRLASACSLPDVTDAYRDWLAQRLEKYVADSNQVLLDVQRFIETGVCLVGDSNAEDAIARDDP